MLRRLHGSDRLALLLLVPLWVACFVLSVPAVMRPAGATSLRVTFWQTADEYPEVLRLADFVPVWDSGARAGDRLLQVDGRDMRGASAVRFYLLYTEAAQDGEPVPALVERDGQRIEVAIPPVSMAILRPMVLISPVFAVFGIAILLRAPRAAVARNIFYLFLAGAFFFSGLLSGPAWLAGFSLVVLTTSGLVAAPLLVRLLLVFPHGVPPRNPSLRSLPWLFAPVGLSTVAMMTGFPYSIRHAEPVAGVLQAISFSVVFVLLHRLYVRSDPVARRQLKVSLLGLTLACLPALFAGVWLTLYPEHRGLAAWFMASLGIGPAFVYLALYRYDLFDVDRLLSATAAYNVALVALAAVFLFLAPRVGEVAESVAGAPAGTGQLAASIALALLVVPVQRYVRPRLEARLFKSQRALESELASLGDELAGVADAKALLIKLGRELHSRIRPESTVLYGRDGERYAALFVDGRAVAAELPTDGPVVATLRGRQGPLCADGQLAGAGARAGDPFVVAALQVLNAAVLLPIPGRGGAPATLVALGPKRSGDLYTATEIHLLRSVADRVALELQRFDAMQFREESRAMQDAMRRYVPGAVADSIERGDALDASEREVTVLFVDIRGYTRLSEASGAQEIFSTVNRYTQAVSGCVRECGGTVVEFNGDGMMAVFGAPGELPEKERCAVRAARRILEEMETIEHGGRSLSVGVGVATGLAYVGDIQAADRRIWSAIGNTTNLAARLQALTRDLNAAVLVDEGTFGALGPERQRFRRHEAIRIRGRSDRLDVFALA